MTLSAQDLHILRKLVDDRVIRSTDGRLRVQHNFVEVDHDTLSRYMSEGLLYNPDHPDRRRLPGRRQYYYVSNSGRVLVGLEPFEDRETIAKPQSKVNDDPKVDIKESEDDIIDRFFQF
jgi:hypothetical protein